MTPGRRLPAACGRIPFQAACAALLLVACVGPARAQSFNVELLARVHGAGTTGVFAAVWGYTAPDGTELAIIGAVDGTEFWDVTDPRQALLVADIPGPVSNWREMQTWSHYAYIVTEGIGPESSGMQIVDLADPLAPRYVGHFDSTFTTAHSIHVRDGYAYVNGTDHGWRVLDLADPERPREVGSWNGRYVHDCFVRGDLAYLANINSGGFTIMNLADRSQPREFSFHSYTGAATHNCWTTEDGNYLLTTDEVNGGILRIWDVRQTAFVAQVATWSVDRPNTSIHNVIVKGDSAYIAYYTEGLQVLDISDPLAPLNVGFYDTYRGVGGLFDGNWGVYPFARNGNIYLSDISTGLYVVRMGEGGQPVLDFHLGAPAAQTAVGPGPVWFYFDLFNGAGGPRGFDVTATCTPPWPVTVPASITVPRSSTEAVMVQVVVPEGITTPTRVDVELCVRNRTSGHSSCAHTRIAVPTVLQSFEVEAAAGGVALRWDLRREAGDDTDLLILRARSRDATTDPFALQARLPAGAEDWRDAEVEPGASYVYRLALDEPAGIRILAERGVTAGTPGRSRLLGNVPNPFNPSTQVRFDLARAGDAALTVFDARGRLVRRILAPRLVPGSHSIAWDGRDASGSAQPSGVYLYEIRSGAWSARGRMTLAK